MSIFILIWILIWGGLYTGEYNIQASMFKNVFSMFQGIRALFPLLALYISIMWMFLKRIRPPAFSTPLGLFFAYCLTGLAVSFFSPDKITSIYWGGLYLSPILFLTIVSENGKSIEILRKLIWVNYGVSLILTSMFFPEMWRIGFSGETRRMFYTLPFELGEVRANGVGRYALIALLVVFIRFLTQKNKTRWLWIIFFIPSIYLLAQSQSRTALLGLAISSVLLFLLWGMRWQFLLAGPAAAYLLWTSGYKWRAQEKLDQLFTLTGREFTWDQAIEWIKHSPFLGWGFHTDRILLDSHHIHNSYIHSMMHGGIIATLFFVAAVISIWILILKSGLLGRIRKHPLPDQPFLMESVCIIGFLTIRSFFESTAAFYGVDLLLLLPAVLYLRLYITKNKEN